MVTIEKLNRLAGGQQKGLHEFVGKFLEEHLQEMKELCLVDEALLAWYVEKTAALRKEFQIREPDQRLNDALYAIMVAAEKKYYQEETIDVLAELVRIFTLRYQEMKNVDESLRLIHSFQDQEGRVSEFGYQNQVG